MKSLKADGRIEVQKVSKAFAGATVIHELNLTIDNGSYCCLLGPSGCGKTTLLRMIAGHEVPSTGQILIGGADVTLAPPSERGTAMMFQSYALFPHISVLDNVAFSLKMRGQTETVRRARARDLLSRVDLDAFAHRLPAQLSGGQQQRVALARALAMDPKVLLLDEPLSALDEHLRLRMRGELRRVQKELGITFIHVTHTQLEAIAVADSVVVMAHGRIEQAASARDIFVAPRNAHVARFIGGQNVICGDVIDRRASSVVVAYSQDSNQAFSVHTAEASNHMSGSKVYASIRRDRVQVARRTDAVMADSSRNILAGVVQAIEYQGTFVKLTIDTEDKEEFVAQILDEEFFGSPIAVGEPVAASWAIADTHLLADRPSI